MPALRTQPSNCRRTFRGKSYLEEAKRSSTCDRSNPKLKIFISNTLRSIPECLLLAPPKQSIRVLDEPEVALPEEIDDPYVHLLRPLMWNNDARAMGPNLLPQLERMREVREDHDAAEAPLLLPALPIFPDRRGPRQRRVRFALGRRPHRRGRDNDDLTPFSRHYSSPRQSLLGRGFTSLMAGVRLVSPYMPSQVLSRAINRGIRVCRQDATARNRSLHRLVTFKFPLL